MLIYYGLLNKIIRIFMLEHDYMDILVINCMSR
jgi:hypothetical protein